MYDYVKPEDSLLLDRLVDNELTDAERRELLQRLERTSDGWRRCALAFLEHQAWRSESKAYHAGHPHAEARPTPAPVASRHWTAQSFWLPLAAAACVFAMFGAWIVIRDGGGQKFARVDVPPGGSVVVSGDPSTGRPQSAPPPFSTPRAAPARQPNVHLVVDGGGNPSNEVVEVPLAQPEQWNDALFGQWSQAVPPEVLRMLEQSGHQVVRERRLVPVDLRDGRRVVVPMDQVEIHPVSVRGYQ